MVNVWLVSFEREEEGEEMWNEKSKEKVHSNKRGRRRTKYESVMTMKRRIRTTKRGIREREQ